MGFMDRFKSSSYALLRIVSGFMFAFHGVQKMFGLFSEHPSPAFGTQMWFGGAIELACGLLIMVGLFTRFAAFLASGEMAVAYFQFHWKLQGGAAFLPGVNKGEMAVLYCFIFLLIASQGPGAWAVDGKR